MLSIVTIISMLKVAKFFLHHLSHQIVIKLSNVNMKLQSLAKADESVGLQRHFNDELDF